MIPTTEKSHISDRVYEYHATLWVHFVSGNKILMWKVTHQYFLSFNTLGHMEGGFLGFQETPLTAKQFLK